MKLERLVDASGARSAAQRLEEAARRGERLGILHGIPVGIKDIVDTADMPTANGNSMDAGRRPENDATLVARIRSAGGLVLGKTVTTELAYLAPAKTRNPWAPEHTPGGSSAGSAAAVGASPRYSSAR